MATIGDPSAARPAGNRGFFAAPADVPGEQLVVKPRPVYLNLVQIRLPLPGLVSILHRISGAALLFLVGIPLLLYALQQSLASPDAFADAAGDPRASARRSSCSSGLIWAYLHHFCAGIRLPPARLASRASSSSPRGSSSVVVLIVSLALTLIIGARLW